MIVDPSADDRLDRAFAALADPVRRRIIARLSRGPATVNELAEPFEITKQAVSKHIQVLEQAGLASRTREAALRGHTETGLIKQGLGARRYEMDVESYDFRTGGRYRYLHRADGEEYA